MICGPSPHVIKVGGGMCDQPVPEPVKYENTIARNPSAKTATTIKTPPESVSATGAMHNESIMAGCRLSRLRSLRLGVRLALD